MASELQTKHDLHCDCGICAYCNGQEDVFGNPTKGGLRGYILHEIEERSGDEPWQELSKWQYLLDLLDGKAAYPRSN